MAEQDEFEAKAGDVWGWLCGDEAPDIKRIADALRAEHTRGQIEGLQLARALCFDGIELHPGYRGLLGEIDARIAELRKGVPLPERLKGPDKPPAPNPPPPKMRPSQR